MDQTVYIFDGVIDDLMGIVAGESLIREQGIGVESRASFYMLPNLGLQYAFLAARDDNSADLAATFKQSHHSGFVFYRQCR